MVHVCSSDKCKNHKYSDKCKNHRQQTSYWICASAFRRGQGLTLAPDNFFGSLASARMSLVPVCYKLYNVLSHSEVYEIAWAADSPCGSQYIVSVAPLLRTARRLDPSTQHSIHVAFSSFIPTLGSRQAMVLEDTKTENCKAFSHLSSWRWQIAVHYRVKNIDIR